MKKTLSTFLLLFQIAFPAETAISSPKDSITIEDFGAKVDDDQDDTNAFLKAIQKCSETPIHAIHLSKGKYNISGEALTLANQNSLKFENFQGLTIHGNGAELLFSGRVSGLVFSKCQNVLIKDLIIDWKRPFFSQGKILNSDSESLSMEVEIDKEYPITGAEKFEAMMDYDPETKLPIGNMDVLANSGFTSCQLIRDQVLKITLKRPTRPDQLEYYTKVFKTLKGKLLVLRHIVYGNYAIDFEKSSNISLSNISIYSAPGMGLHAGEVDNISLKNVGIRIRPKSNRLMSTTADCQYYTHCSGMVTIEDSYFEGMGDDGINICAKYKTITKVTKPSTIESLVEGKTWKGVLPEEGDTVEIADSRTLEKRFVSKVKSGVWDQKAGVFRTELVDAIPDSVKVKDFLVVSNKTAKAVIKRSTFRGMRSRAMIFSTRDVTIEDCKIEAPGFGGIMLMAGNRSAYQGPTVENFIIRNNTFEGCGAAAIFVDTSVISPGPAHRNLIIEGNTIRENKALKSLRILKNDKPHWIYWTSAIGIIAVDGVSLLRNKIEGYDIALFIDRSKNIKIDGNLLSAPSQAIINTTRTENIQMTNSNNLNQSPVPQDLDSSVNYINIYR